MRNEAAFGTIGTSPPDSLFSSSEGTFLHYGPGA